MRTDNDEIPNEAYLAIIVWGLWMLFINIAVYFIDCFLLFVFVFVGSCLLGFSTDRLLKKARKRSIP